MTETHEQTAATVPTTAAATDTAGVRVAGDATSPLRYDAPEACAEPAAAGSKPGTSVYERFEETAAATATPAATTAGAAGTVATTAATARRPLREEFAELRTSVDTMLSTAESEGRVLTAAERTEYDRQIGRLEQINQLQADQRRAAQFAAIDVFAPTMAGTAAAASPAATPAATAALQAGGNPVRRSTGASPRPASQATREQFGAVIRAVDNWIRTGREATEEFTLTTSTGGGVLVPTMVAQPTVIRRWFNPILAALAAYGYAPIETTTTANMSLPVMDDTANTATQIAEDSTGDNRADAAFTGIQLGAKLYDSGTYWESNTALAAIPYDLMAYLSPALTKRIELKQAADWVAKLKTATNVFVSSAPSTVTYDDMNNFAFSLGYLYRPDGVFILSDPLMQAVAAVKDNQGRPIFVPSMSQDVPSTLFGKPVFATDQFAAPAAGNVAGAFVSAECLKVRMVTNQRLVRYVDYPPQPDQTGIRLFVNADFGFVNQGVSLFKFHA